MVNSKQWPQAKINWLNLINHVFSSNYLQFQHSICMNQHDFFCACTCTIYKKVKSYSPNPGRIFGKFQISIGIITLFRILFTSYNIWCVKIHPKKIIGTWNKDSHVNPHINITSHLQIKKGRDFHRVRVRVRVSGESPKFLAYYVINFCFTRFLHVLITFGAASTRNYQRVAFKIKN